VHSKKWNAERGWRQRALIPKMAIRRMRWRDPGDICGLDCGFGDSAANHTAVDGDRNGMENDLPLPISDSSANCQ